MTVVLQMLPVGHDGGVRNTTATGLEVTNSEIVTYVHVLLILIGPFQPDLTVPDVK